QSQRVTIELNGRSLAYYNPNRNAWVVDADVFTIGVGAASNDIRLRGRVLSPFRQQLSVTSSNPLPLAVQRAVQVTAGGQGPDQTDDVLFTQTQSTAPQVPPAAGSGGSAPGSAP
ncbi:fibronectin type III-like domain-contianing protein, partial [Pseudomonas sp.]